MQRKLQAVDIEFKAVALFHKYNELRSDLASVPKNNIEAFYWNNNLQISLIETLFSLVDESEGWGAAVNYMIRDNREFILEHKFDCDPYNKLFIERISQTLGKKICLEKE